MFLVVGRCQVGNRSELLVAGESRRGECGTNHNTLVYSAVARAIRLYFHLAAIYSYYMIRLRLETLLKDCGWTAYRLSKESGIHPTVIRKYYHNRVKSVSLETLDVMCKTLGCQPGDLIEWVTDTSVKGKSMAARHRVS